MVVEQFQQYVGFCHGSIDPLNAWGLTLIGAALIAGVFVRWSAFWGAVMLVPVCQVVDVS
jgi:uncharacterized membrane protein YphA (DoxX/SURF4 family)